MALKMGHTLCYRVPDRFGGPSVVCTKTVATVRSITEDLSVGLVQRPLVVKSLCKRPRRQRRSEIEREDCLTASRENTRRTASHASLISITHGQPPDFSPAVAGRKLRLVAKKVSDGSGDILRGPSVRPRR